MDNLIKESIQLTIKKEGYQLPKHTKKWLGYGWSSPRWYVTLTGKTESGRRITQYQYSQSLTEAIRDLKNDLKKLCDDTDITFKTLSKSGEKGVLLDTLLERNNWYLMFLDYLDGSDD